MRLQSTCWQTSGSVPRISRWCAALCSGFAGQQDLTAACLAQVFFATLLKHAPAIQRAEAAFDGSHRMTWSVASMIVSAVEAQPGSECRATLCSVRACVHAPAGRGCYLTCLPVGQQLARAITRSVVRGAQVA